MDTITPTSNIPATGFSAKDIQHYAQTRSVRFNVSAFFTLSLFSIRQLLLATELPQYAGLTDEEVAMYRKLSFYMIMSLDNKSEDKPSMELTRAEVLVLRRWLEARMQHCEMEREERLLMEQHDTMEIPVSPREAVKTAETFHKFNPDTYIAQKFLLLDIREWLLGDIEE